MKKLAVLLCLLLHGCWFVYIPGSAIDYVKDSASGEFGNNCVAAIVKEGDVIPFTDGRKGRVVKISGPSDRCREKDFPLRAEVDFSN